MIKSLKILHCPWIERDNTFLDNLSSDTFILTFLLCTTERDKCINNILRDFDLLRFALFSIYFMYLNHVVDLTKAPFILTYFRLSKVRCMVCTSWG